MNVTDRFFSAATSAPATDSQKDASRTLTESHADLAELIVTLTPAGRYQSLALTALEEALMWANKGIYAEAMS